MARTVRYVDKTQIAELMSYQNVRSVDLLIGRNVDFPLPVNPCGVGRGNKKLWKFIDVKNWMDRHKK